MADEKTALIKAVADALPAKEMYRDALQPVAVEVGSAAGELGAVVRASLRPLRTLRIAWDAVFDRLDDWVADRLRGTLPEEVVEPPPNLAGGVIAGLVFVQEEPDLRDLFLQLLASSMMKGRRSAAHPAFAEFIKQMTPLEARIVKFMANRTSLLSLNLRSHEMPKPVAPPPANPSTPFATSPLLAALTAEAPIAPMASVLHAGTSGDGQTMPPMSQMNDEQLAKQLDDPPFESWTDELTLSQLDLASEFAGDAPLLPALENLQRLQLLRVSDELSNPSEIAGYTKIARSTQAMAFIKAVETRGRHPGLHMGLILRTSLGDQFLRVCIAGKAG